MAALAAWAGDARSVTTSPFPVWAPHAGARAGPVIDSVRSLSFR